MGKRGGFAEGRNRIPDTWCVVKDVEDGQLFAVEPTSQPSYFSGTRYQLCGRFSDKEDAEQFILFKRMGTACDRLAYLEKAYSMRDKADVLPSVDIAGLKEKCDAMRTSTGRTCFGKCRSLDGKPACAICYSDLPKTWELCATTSILAQLLAQRRPTET